MRDGISKNNLKTNSDQFITFQIKFDFLRIKYNVILIIKLLIIY